MNSKILILLTGITFLLVACVHQDSTIAKNTLLVDIGAEVGSLDPIKTDDAEDLRVINDLYAGVVDFNQKNQPIPGLAESWNISSDGKTYIFHLRHGLTFSDGSPLTAYDVLYSWERLVNPASAAPYGFILNNVVNATAIMQGKLPITSLGVEAPNLQTFVVHLTKPMNEFLTYLTLPAVAVVPRKIIEKYGDKWTDPTNIVTSGAYVLKEHVVNGYILSQKNLHYYASKNVHIYQVKYYPLVDTNTAIASYDTNTLDTTWKNIPIDRFMVIYHQYPKQLHITQAERIIFLSLNMKLAKYNNVKLRQALAMAIDRNILTQAVLNSGQQPLYSIVTPTIENGKYASVKYSWADQSREQQILQAKRLYYHAGFNAHNPLIMTLSYYNNDLNKKLCLAIATMWQQVLGVKVNLEVQELKAFTIFGHQGNFDIRLSTWGADYNSVTTYTPLYQCNLPNNYSQYCNLHYEQLIAQAQNMTNLELQRKNYIAALQIVMTDYPVISLIQPTQQRLVKPKVKNYKINDNYLDNVQSKWFTLDDH